MSDCTEYVTSSFDLFLIGGPCGRYQQTIRIFACAGARRSTAEHFADVRPATVGDFFVGLPGVPGEDTYPTCGPSKPSGASGRLSVAYMCY